MPPIAFTSVEQELHFLRGLVRVHEIADAILEDCLDRQLGLIAAVDVFLGQSAKMLGARASFVQLLGSRGPVVSRVLGTIGMDIEKACTAERVTTLAGGQTLFTAPLDLGKKRLGTIGFLLDRSFDDAAPVAALVKALAEALDSAVLGFIALADGRDALDRLDELGAMNAFRPRGRIGKYELLTPLGTGGMAQVMVARASGPEGVGRLVALKRILPQLTSDPSMVEQFLDEARLGLRLGHPNLVTFHDFGESHGTYYLVMELIRGVDLDRVLESTFDAGLGAPPLWMVSSIVGQALVGLHAAHQLMGEDGLPLGLVHRDLSPHNLMVGFEGRVKVLDFGVAKARQQRTVTLVGIVKGKPLYMSPEQAVGDRLDHRSDLFAMGLILYEALTGRRAFQRDDEVKAMEAIVNEPLTRPEEIDRKVWSVIDRALEKDPERRFRSALEMAKALHEAVKPASEDELSRWLRNTLPKQVEDLAKWERELSQQRKAVA